VVLLLEEAATLPDESTVDYHLGVVYGRAAHLSTPQTWGSPTVAASERRSLREARNLVAHQTVVDALMRMNSNISRAAVELGISRPALHDLLEKHRIDSKEFDRWETTRDWRRPA
jgi:DNA-binding NtrC family response regulator